MFRPASRVIRASASSTSFRATPRATTQRRLLSTAPPAQKKRSWKSFALRLGAVGGIIYWYNTSNVFAEEPAYVHPSLPSTDHESENLPTLDSITASRRKQQLSEPPQSQSSSPSTTAPAAAETVKSAGDGEAPLAGSPEELEEEADQQGAFNPETGEINWDCPCLGGMAHGPCGEQFKAAFSCFVYSKEEPKGVDCIEHFKTMQNCFRDHPDVYGSELDDDDEDNMDEPREGEGEKQPAIRDGGPAVDATGDNVPDDKLHGEKVAHAKPGKTGAEQEVNTRRERAKTATEQVKREHEPQSEVDEAVPKAWHDQSDANNQGKK